MKIKFIEGYLKATERRKRMPGKRMRGDNAKLRKIDEQLGWVDKDGNSAASIAESQGVAGHIIGKSRGLPVVAWESGGIWSYCILNRHRFFTTTLLARSKQGLERLLTKAYERVTDESTAQRWHSYYGALWERRYRKWVHKPGKCGCQLCRMGIS